MCSVGLPRHPRAGLLAQPTQRGGHLLDRLGTSMELRRRVLKQHDLPLIPAADGDDRLDDVAVGHKLAAVGRDHAGDAAHDGHVWGDLSDVLDAPDVLSRYMVGEDRGQVLGDRPRANFGASVEADAHASSVEEIGKALGVARVPAVVETGEQVLGLTRPSDAGPAVLPRVLMCG